MPSNIVFCFLRGQMWVSTKILVLKHYYRRQGFFFPEERKSLSLESLSWLRVSGTLSDSSCFDTPWDSARMEPFRGATDSLQPDPPLRHYERGLFTGGISRISSISKEWSDSPLFSAVWGFSTISRISKFSRKWTFLKKKNLFQKTPFLRTRHPVFWTRTWNGEKGQKKVWSQGREARDPLNPQLLHPHLRNCLQ